MEPHCTELSPQLAFPGKGIKSDVFINGHKFEGRLSNYLNMPRFFRR